jgi:hypothetical protein
VIARKVGYVDQNERMMKRAVLLNMSERHKLGDDSWSDLREIRDPACDFLAFAATRAPEMKFNGGDWLYHLTSAGLAIAPNRVTAKVGFT